MLGSHVAHCTSKAFNAAIGLVWARQLCAAEDCPHLVELAAILGGGNGEGIANAIAGVGVGDEVDASVRQWARVGVRVFVRDVGLLRLWPVAGGPVPDASIQALLLRPVVKGGTTQKGAVSVSLLLAMGGGCSHTPIQQDVHLLGCVVGSRHHIMRAFIAQMQVLVHAAPLLAAIKACLTLERAVLQVAQTMSQAAVGGGAGEHYLESTWQ